MMAFEDRIKAYQDSIKEAERYIEKANAAIDHLESEGYARYQSRKNASAKRASMDLSNALVEVRRVI
ncbi:MAG: hypothetical protein KAJ03_01130 [Gammaproteobacteria bacterium]|nr:hypothetical protein [Gammaproteobacteria bacterium]